MTSTVYPIELEKTTEKITPNAGLLMMSELMDAMGILESIQSKFKQPGSNRGYKPEEIVKQVILMLIGGGNRLSDIRILEEDKAIQEICGIKKVANEDTLGETFRRWDRQGGAKILKELAISVAQKGLTLVKQKEFTLDPDATEIQAGKKSAARSYKGNKGYMPLIGFLREVPFCINAYFRAGNESPAADNLELFQEAKKNMPKGKKITNYGSDAAGYQGAIIDECYKKKEKVTFTITANQDRAIKTVIKEAAKKGTWFDALDKKGEKTGRQYCLTVHKMNKNQHAFGILIEREEKQGQQELWDSDGYWYHVIAHNFSYEEGEEKETGKKIIARHRKRSGSENHNKELKSGIGMEYMPCGTHGANTIFFWLGVLAYNLTILLKILGTTGTTKNFLKKTIKTLRWELFGIAGKVVKHARKTIVKLAGIAKKRLQFIKTIRKRIALQKLKLCPS